MSKWSRSLQSNFSSQLESYDIEVRGGDLLPFSCKSELFLFHFICGVEKKALCISSYIPSCRSHVSSPVFGTVAGSGASAWFGPTSESGSDRAARALVSVDGSDLGLLSRQLWRQV